MMEKSLKQVVLWTMLVFLVAGCNEKAPPQPNILLILAGDLGYSDVSCYGSEIATPHIDALASEGIMFSRKP
jgi:hypothetical protein